MTIARTLDSVDFLTDLPSAARAELAQHCRWTTHAPHAEIIDRFSASRDVYFVTSGRARVVIYSGNGREVLLDDIPTGGFFGELAALDGRDRSASVVALEETVTAALSDKQFVQLVAEQPLLSRRLIDRLVAVVRVNTDRIYDLALLGASNRVMAELVRLGRKAGVTAQGRAILHPTPVFSEIASRISSTRETVSRVVNDLVRHHVLARQDDSLVITDIGRLQDMVEQMLVE